MREWLNAHAASGYVNYLADSGRYQLSPEQAMLFAQEESPAFIVGGFQTALAAGRIVDRLTDAFKSGDGIGWHEHHPDMFPGCARFYKVGYLNHLVQEWIPALDGVEARLKAGIRVADVGCGVGYSTLIMAKAFPNSHFTGFDYHDESIAAADQHAREAGVDERELRDRQGGQLSAATRTSSSRCSMRCTTWATRLAASRHVLKTLAPNGTWMIVEPYAGRSHRGEPEPARPRVLRGIHAVVHALLVVAGRPHGSGRAGGRGALAIGDHRARDSSDSAARRTRR